MNASTANQTRFSRRLDDRREKVVPVHNAYRTRDFGVGYGRSSGYGTDRRYSGRAFTPMYANA
ncbi:hypothetical protein H4F99_02250 [Lysobacter sp. SG-8]|uniref:Uncharacterized protein n=1 Tax=Marilutibacter penaei TaxID=2759900 RepID=A0A7W3U1M5_9GAMM|nr:hypothetical protein [Lysobacter penaei]MBB1087306.1 hypothetical protein [Lysobacter penaei]